MNYFSTIQTSNLNTTYITNAYCYTGCNIWSSYYNKFDAAINTTNYINEPVYISTLTR